MADIERFQLPDQLAALDDQGRQDLYAEIGALDDNQLSGLLEDSVAAFRNRSAAQQVTDTDLAEMRALAAVAEHIRGEQHNRRQAAEQAAAEIDQLASQVLGEDAVDTDTDEAADEAADDDSGGEDGTAQDPAGTADGDTAANSDAAQVAASGVPARMGRRPAMDLSQVRRNQPRLQLPTPDPLPEIIAAVDVPGYSPGERLQLPQVVEGTIRRANALKTAGGGTGLVASYRLPFSDALTVTDSSSAPEGTTKVIEAASQQRLPQGDIVASGGWCAPSETVYDIADIACPDMLWDLPEVGLSRGGIRYFLTPPLDVSAMTWVHTEADDISGAEKPCFHIPCPDPVEVRCDAIGVCLEAGILTERHFPELVRWYVRNAMVAHEIRIRQHLMQQVLDMAGDPDAVIPVNQVTLPATFGALSAVYAAVGLQIADMVERYSLCERISLEVVFPWWLRNLFLADLARRNGVDVCDLSPGCIQDVFNTLGVRVQFARGLPPAVPADLGGEDPALAWPSELTFLLYPAGSFQIGRGAEVSLGVVHDSAKFSTNDYTAMFSEECVALVSRGPEARLITVPICPDGATGAQTELACPAA